jgi:ribonuclease HI
METRPILAFADGACSGNPGPGGWGLILVTPDGQVTELGGHEPDTTNNRMELTAVGRALRHLEHTPGPLLIHSDSTYVIQGITRWVHGWRQRGWKTAQGTEVANAAYWRRLMALLAQRKEAFPPEAAAVEWRYVRGHAGVPGNERADEIAVAFSRGQRVKLYTGSLSNYGVAVLEVPEEASPPEDEPKPRAASGKAYSYLSQVGGTVRRHATWAACERQVKGISGARYKKTTSAADEARVLRDWDVRPEEVQADPEG